LPAGNIVLSFDPLSAVDQDIAAEDILAVADILGQVTDIQVVEPETLAVLADIPVTDILVTDIPVTDIQVVEPETLAVLADIQVVEPETLAVLAEIHAAVADILVAGILAVAGILVAGILVVVADILVVADNPAAAADSPAEES